MPYYLVVHEEPSIPRETIESRWVDLAVEARAFWRKTWHNLDIGKRYCWWDAMSKEILEQIFRDYGITWESITEVKLTTPADWMFRDD
ncbi:MAG: nickel-binding protein [Desulfomonilaceae bacterium]